MIVSHVIHCSDGSTTAVSVLSNRTVSTGWSHCRQCGKYGMYCILSPCPVYCMLSCRSFSYALDFAKSFPKFIFLDYIVLQQYVVTKVNNVLCSDISSNPITSIPMHAFSHLPSLQYLYARANH